MRLVKGGTVYLGQGRYEAGWDVLCDGPVIREVGPGLSANGAEIIHAAGRCVYPGIVLGLCAVGAVAFSGLGYERGVGPHCPPYGYPRRF